MPEPKPHQLSLLSHAKDRGKVLGILIVSLVYDAVFIAAWVLVNWSVEAHVIEPLALQGVDHWILSVLRLVFGLATLVCVLVFVVEDLATIFLQAYARVKSATKGRGK